MQHSNLLPYQQCTVNWVTKQLGDKRRSVRRFLVADEVGLGKTKVASELIQNFLKEKPNLFVVYVTSSLDISQQNRRKLCKSPDEMIHTDRVCLLYNSHLPTRGLRVLSLTPSTSFDLSKGTGSIKERAYIARYLAKRFNFASDILIDRLKGMASRQNFNFEFDQTAYVTNLPPERVCSAIDSAWEKSGAVEKLRSSRTHKSEFNKVVSKLRFEMAKAILNNLNPDLIIMDEVQKFPQLIETNTDGEPKHETAKGFLKSEIPTLLLSATPFRTFVSAAEAHQKSIHVEELKKVLLFLTASPQETQKLTDLLHSYTSNLKKLSKENVQTIVNQKQKIQLQIMKYISRAERINFEEEAHAPFQERIMNPERYQLTRSHIAEYLRLKSAVTSKRSFLHLWRSGQAPLSYMHGDYKILDRISDTNHLKIASDRNLFSDQGRSEKHCKLSYLKEDLLKDRELRNFLWIPPTRPYYSGEGIYSPENIQRIKPKKGLIFSSWSFVPRMIAAELSAWNSVKDKKYTTQNPLKDNISSYFKFWHPSLWIATTITHESFESANSYKNLLKLAEKDIRSRLAREGWTISKKGIDTWELLSALDFQTNEDFLKYISIHFLRPTNEFTRREKKAQSNPVLLKRADLAKLRMKVESRVVSNKAVSELAEIAISSPAICLLRTFLSLEVLKSDCDGEVLGRIADFCARNWKAFFNRHGTAKVINSSYSNRLTYADKLQRYLKDGNIQAVLDEYIYHLQPGNDEEAYREVLKKLAVVFGPKGGNLQIQMGKKRKPKRVRAEMIAMFGKTDDQSASRESVRESFNSPFWPFVLATTSVGQEGLDFHLYCKDIYHWNLPANPVDFEQREGRINRFNSLWVRESLCRSVKISTSQAPFWKKLYSEAFEHSHRNDRYNLGMSPHWTFTPKVKDIDRGYVRHMLIIPGSEEGPRYKSLLRDLELYRLTLGQPNQSKFMEDLKSNDYLKQIDIRGLTICLFPIEKKFWKKKLLEKFRNESSWELLIADARDLIRTMKRDPNWLLRSKKINRDILILRSGSLKQKKSKSLFALLDFVNPYNEIHDCTPVIGLNDDEKKLKRA